MGSTISRGRRARAVRATLGLLTVSLLSALSLVTTAAPSSAAADEGVGVELDPGQPYADGHLNWLGSYVVDGEQVFCVRYGFTAPDTDEEYQPGDELLDKWGQPLESDVAADISYLLLQYGDTDDTDEAAALAHLLHSWTAAPRAGEDDLDESKSRQEIGYDVDGNFEQLPQSAKDAVERMRAEAEANRGPWTASVSSPKDELTIDTAAEWTISVRNANDEGVPNRPVTVTLTGASPEETGDDAIGAGEDEPKADVVVLEDAALEDGPAAEDTAAEDALEEGVEEDSAKTVTVTTDEDGNATVRATPTSTEATLSFELVAPAERPYVRFPVQDGVQQVVSTGGEQQLQAEVTVNAKPKPPETTTETSISTSTVIVPRTIPAGEQPAAVAQGDTHSGPGIGALAGLGALALIGAGLVGWVARRRLAQR